jgi:hypothetical protein
VKHDNLTPFKRGVSGNPGGRPKTTALSLARKHTPEAIQALVDALKNPKERVPAAVALLNRGWGMPKQPIEGDVDLLHWVVRAPAPVADADDWFRRYAPPEALEHDPGD